MDSNSKLPNENNDSKIGVVLISHGSSLPASQNTFEEIKKEFQNQTNYHVEIGYMKVSKPSIPEAVNLLSSYGVEKIIAIPVFLAKGIHTNIDIPIMLGLNPKETDPRSPNGTYPENHYLNQVKPANFANIILLDPFGPDELILEIIESKINAALSKIAIDKSKVGIILVSHGSRLNYNKEFITDLFNLYSKNNDYNSTFAFMELTHPSISESINDLTSKIVIEHLIVVPVFIATGVHTTRDIPTILKLIDIDKENNHTHDNDHTNSHSLKHSHSHDHTHSNEKIDFNGEITYLDPIGADPILIELIKRRVNNVL
ncbi:sirohydrochlorin nickelochelatase [Methanobrevibacter filiformis]|uniref:Sirohydrochlorin cobaltochelatase n=1 Tax=Methanobrevibacter filiformis TaxID=55758 RepID=A0A165Z6K9_9EURY|nr:sirohydrochlorin nickelochelatase [Methanobrevibacter filiformis]KZX10311.1 sirohydrochlorin cobaltochelatase [Methanobrevibacter filiformis]